MSLNIKPQNRNKKPRRTGSLAVRSRNLNALLFVTIAFVIALVIAMEFGAVVKEISSGYVEGYAVSSAEALSAHIDKEIGLLSKAAHSDAVVKWFEDEGNEQKKDLAQEELREIVGELYSFNLYASVSNSLNEYAVRSGDTAESFRPIAVLNESEPSDDWYFECMDSEKEYAVSVNIDHVMQRKRIWLDYKVVRGGAVLGVISTGLEFSHVVGELFSHDNYIRGLIIDDNGAIHMDSSLMNDKDFMYSNFANSVSNEFSDPALLAAVESYLDGARDAAEGTGEAERIELTSAQYRYTAIAPIRLTDWSVVILSGNWSTIDLSLFIPIAVTALILLIVFSVVSDAVSRLIFQPLDKLDRSLALMKGNGGGTIFGAERDDELGHLSQTTKEKG